MFKRAFLYMLCCIFVLVTSCSQAENVDNINNDNQNVDNLDGDNKDVDKSDKGEVINNEYTTQPNNKLGFALLDKVERDKNNNIFISPSSAFMALSMAYNGSEGETKDEIAEALQIKDISVDQLNQANAVLVDKLQKDTQATQLSIANSIWLNKQFHFTDEFSDATTTFYDAETTEIDITDDRSVDKINDWVSESTNDKITDIVEGPLNEDMVAILINALYFEGKWKYPFSEARTEEEPFYSGGTENNIPMMMLEEELAYMENDEFQAVKLPYQDDEMNMTIFLPSENSTIDTFIAAISDENWQEWQAEFQEMNGIIKLPTFELEYETNLNEAFQLLGMELAFKKQDADFSKMIKEDAPLWIHEIKQKTYINVDEKGTEAAAVTSIEMRTESAVVGDTFYMEVNRPFFMTITDNETDTILFMGVITNPNG
ncbi:serpin family protein [Pseudogracilibacillus auburnensis]|uniref:Serpin B n=1 Tax=Pseudogracilibacillus auburnensis TaxID=1494959 RepID=A0A2V3VVC3_9BACI|nr:serpin family protein [Pseudogracilibacillus auburnensis]PXW85606.1 serpin B [Pseudogracilibacillus auburnensis]